MQDRAQNISIIIGSLLAWNSSKNPAGVPDCMHHNNKQPTPTLSQLQPEDLSAPAVLFALLFEHC